MGKLEFDETSDFSHSAFVVKAPSRRLLFVRDRGEEVVQTRVNMKKPYELLHDCNRMMFASYSSMPKPERVLIVGLGGGAMVHFLKHYDSKVQVDAVEIDPVVAKLADRDLHSCGEEREHHHRRRAEISERDRKISTTSSTWTPF